jgi:MoaA/NifB/PqqE/SkfB family radical SAM enzyme
MNQNEGFSHNLVLNKSLHLFFKQAVHVAIRNPMQAVTFIRTLYWLRKAAAIREEWKQENVTVPPIIIFSITNHCNLRSIGCYEQSFHTGEGKELDELQIRSLLAQAKELGVSFFVLAGGEPFMRANLLTMLAEYPEIIFLVFTNGLLLTDSVIERLKKQKNVVPLISLEGDEQATDQRRGDGVYRKVMEVAENMRQRGIFFGTSLTLTRQNYDQLISESFVSHLSEQGCKIFLYLEYTPVADGTEK